MKRKKKKKIILFNSFVLRQFSLLLGPQGILTHFDDFRVVAKKKNIFLIWRKILFCFVWVVMVVNCFRAANFLDDEAVYKKKRPGQMLYNNPVRLLACVHINIRFLLSFSFLFIRETMMDKVHAVIHTQQQQQQKYSWTLSSSLQLLLSGNGYSWTCPVSYTILSPSFVFWFLYYVKRIYHIIYRV